MAEVKKLLTTELAAAVKAAIKEYKVEQQTLSSDCVNAICNVTEAVFLHGLKEQYYLKNAYRTDKYPEPSYWQFVSKMTHRNVRAQIGNLTQIKTDIGRSRAWVRIALNERSMGNYVELIIREPQLIRHYYHRYAILRDAEQIEIFKDYMKALAQVAIQVPVNSSVLNQWTPTPLRLAGIMESCSSILINRIGTNTILESEELDIPVAMSALEYEGIDSPSSSISSTRMQQNYNRIGIGNVLTPNRSAFGPSDDAFSDSSSYISDVSHMSLVDAQYQSILSNIDRHPSSDFLFNNNESSTIEDVNGSSSMIEGTQFVQDTSTGMHLSDGKVDDELTLINDEVNVVFRNIIPYQQPATLQNFENNMVRNEQYNASDKLLPRDGDSRFLVNADANFNEESKNIDDKSVVDSDGQKADVIEESFDDILTKMYKAEKIKQIDKLDSINTTLPYGFESDDHLTNLNAVLRKSESDLDESAYVSSSSSVNASAGVDLPLPSPSNYLEESAFSPNTSSLLNKCSWSSGFVANIPNDQGNFSSVLQQALHSGVLSSSPVRATDDDLIDDAEFNRNVRRNKNRFSDAANQPLEVGRLLDADDDTVLQTVFSDDAQFATHTSDADAPSNEPQNHSNGLHDFEEIQRPISPHRNSRISKLSKISYEWGLDAQNYKCNSCCRLIGLTFGEFRLCDFDGCYYCTECHIDDDSAIPARILLNWDFKHRKISRCSKAYLDHVAEEPLMNISSINHSLYDYSSDIKDVLKLRQQLSFVAMYLLTCKETVAEEMRKRLWPKEYLWENVHLYAFNDLLQVPDGHLAKQLRSVISFAIRHVQECRLCSQKGFICEICNDTQIIYPFQVEITQRCEKCCSVYHQKCARGRPCPKCQRREQYTKSKKTPTGANAGNVDVMQHLSVNKSNESANSNSRLQWDDELILSSG